MLELGEQLVTAEGAEDRIRLVCGDMADCQRIAPEQLDLVSCVLALHQLPSVVELASSLRAIAAVRERTGCAIWIWDLARLRDDDVMRSWISKVTESDALFLRDALASEAAAWTLAELTDALEDAGLAGLRHRASRPSLFQAHWISARFCECGVTEDWREIMMSSVTLSRVEALHAAFDGLPR
jgi:tRNA (cmo5U34)-methyltransferase